MQAVGDGSQPCRGEAGTGPRQGAVDRRATACQQQQHDERQQGIERHSDQAGLPMAAEDQRVPLFGRRLRQRQESPAGCDQERDRDDRQAPRRLQPRPQAALEQRERDRRDAGAEQSLGDDRERRPGAGKIGPGSERQQDEPGRGRKRREGAEPGRTAQPAGIDRAAARAHQGDQIVGLHVPTLKDVPAFLKFARSRRKVTDLGMRIGCIMAPPGVSRGISPSPAGRDG